jgi:hypothetical protein
VLSDVVAILTGTTDKDTLSASCDKASTTITSVVAAGWTVHDSSAGTNAVCIKAPLADNASAYKYVVVDTNTAGSVYTKVYETWSDSTHTGTNLTTGSSSSTASQRVDYAAGGLLNIGASERYCCLTGTYGTTYGTSNGTYPLTGCYERTRIGPWDTVAKGVPPFLYMVSNGLGTEYAPRLLRYDNTSLTTTNATLKIGTIGLTDLTVRPTTYNIINENNVQVTPMWPMYVSNTALMNCPYGNISSLCDIWLLPDSVAAPGTTFTSSGKTYIVFKGTANGQSRFAIRAE